MTQPDSTDTLTIRPAHLIPTGQPQHVRDMAKRLLDAYQVEGGTAHLAGCTLDEVPVVRLTWEPADEPPQNVYVIFGQANINGKIADAELMQTLQLDDVADAECPVSVSPKEVDRLVRAATACASHSNSAKRDAPDAASVIWCKYARVNIQFSIGAATAHTSFAGWARTLEPQPYSCPITETKSFAVAATSDGRIVPAEELESCQQSSRRLPRCELVRCAATEKMVARDLTVRCPASGKVVLESALVECPTCRQRVGPGAMSGRRCAACSRTSTVQKNDPRIVRIFARYPQLANWNWLRMSESDAVYIVIAAGLLERRLLVVDKESLDTLRHARGNRLSSAWTDEPSESLDSP